MAVFVNIDLLWANPIRLLISGVVLFLLQWMMQLLLWTTGAKQTPAGEVGLCDVDTCKIKARVGM